MINLKINKRYGYINGCVKLLSYKLKTDKGYFCKGRTWFIVYEDGHMWDTNFSASGKDRFYKNNFRLKLV